MSSCATISSNARPTFGRNDRDGDGKADPAVLRQNQFGGTFGGPIVRNKAFFFGSIEAWRVRRAQSDLNIVPTAAERAGDFSMTRNLNRLIDPNSSSVVADRTTFANKTIPMAMQDPVGSALAQIYPSPNLADPATRNNFTSGEPWFTDRNQYDFRYDQTFSHERQHVRALQHLPPSTRTAARRCPAWRAAA